MGKSVRYVLKPAVRESDEPLDSESLDRTLYRFNLQFRDLQHMTGETGVKLKPAGAFDRLLEYGGGVREGGLKLISYVAYVRRNRSEVGRVLDHLEAALRLWKRGEVPAVDAHRLALYRVMAHEVGVGEGISAEASPLGLRHLRIGGEYMEHVRQLTGEVQARYREAEDVYMALAREIYGSRMGLTD